MKITIWTKIIISSLVQYKLRTSRKQVKAFIISHPITKFPAEIQFSKSDQTLKNRNPSSSLLFFTPLMYFFGGVGILLNLICGVVKHFFFFL